MKYKITKEYNLKEAVSRERQALDYALLYQFSACRLCKTEEVSDADWDTCMEARFFGRQKEFHVFPQEGYGILIEDQIVEERESDERESDEGIFCERKTDKSKSGEEAGLSWTESDQLWRDAVQIERTYRLAHRDIWSTVTVYQYLEQDEDGQNRIVLTRLADLNLQED